MECPNCGKYSIDVQEICECGYDYASKEVESEKTKIEYKVELATVNTWKIALFIVGVLIIGYRLINNADNLPLDLSYIFGYSFPVAFIVWGLFYMVYKKQLGGNRTFFAFCMIFTSLFFANVIGAYRSLENVRLGIDEIKSHMSEFESKTLDNKSQIIKTKSDFSNTSAKGDIGKVSDFMKNYLNQLELAQKEYLLELEAIGWNEIMDFTRILADKTGAESKFIIGRAEKLIVNHEKRCNAILIETRKDIASINFDDIDNKEMVEGFDKGMAESETQRNKLFALEKKIVKGMERIVMMLHDNNVTWSVQSEQVLFVKNKDLEKYNSYVTLLMETIEAQEQLQKSMLNRASKNFDKLGAY